MISAACETPSAIARSLMFSARLSGNLRYTGWVVSLRRRFGLACSSVSPVACFAGGAAGGCAGEGVGLIWGAVCDSRQGSATGY